ncbi:MAG: hypothetical protein ACJAS1_006098, partial [Oleiphilaceae bacterium]
PRLSLLGTPALLSARVGWLRGSIFDANMGGKWVNFGRNLTGSVYGVGAGEV